MSIQLGKIGRCLFFISISGLLLSCTRSINKDAKVNIALPQFLKSSKTEGVKALPTGTIHVEVVVGGNTPNPSRFSFDSDCNCAAGTDLPPPEKIEMEVSPGPQKLIQVIAVIEDQTEERIIFKYGDIVQDLGAGENAVNITIKEEASGDGTEGSIAGRFLTTSGQGPTGKVFAEYLPTNGRPPMRVLQKEIFGGWFNFFLIDGINFRYVMDNGTVLFNQAGNGSSELVPNNTMMHVKVPNHFESDDNPQGFEEEEGANIYFGFFGPSAVSELVCFNSTQTSIQDLFTDATLSTPLQWFPDGAGGPSHINRVGGGVSNDGPQSSICTTTANEFIDHLSFDEQKLEDGSRDFVGFEGPFASLGTNDFEKLSFTKSGTNITVNWKYLPGALQGADAIDGVRIFQIADPSLAGNVFADDGLKCSKLATNGYQNMGDVAQPAESHQFTDLQVQFPPPPQGGGDFRPPPIYAACPFRNVAGGKEFFNTAAGSFDFGDNGGPSKGVRLELAGGGNLPLSIDVNVCIDIDVIFEEDGDETPVDQATNINLNTGGPGGADFFDGAGCGGGPQTNVNIAAAVSRKTISFKATANEFYNFSIQPSGDFFSAGHDIGVTAVTPNPIQFALNVFANEDPNTNDALVAETQCYEVNANIVDGGGKPSKPNSAFADAPLSSSGGFTTTFFSDESCTTPITQLAFAANSHVSKFFFSVTGTGSGSIDLANGGTHTPTITAGSQNMVSGPNTHTAYQIRTFDDGFKPNDCTFAEIQSVNSVGATVSVNGTKNLTLNSSAGGSFHFQGDCSDSPITSTQLNSGNSFNGVHFILPSGTTESVLDVTDGTITGLELMTAKLRDNTPFQNLFVNLAKKSDNNVPATYDGSIHTDANVPFISKVLSVNTNSAISLSGNRAMFHLAHRVVFSGSPILSVDGDLGQTGVTSTAGIGGDGSSGGGGGGGTGDGNGGNGDGAGFDGVTGTGTGFGAGGFGTGNSYIVGGFSYPAGGLGGNGGLADGSGIAGTGGTASPGAGGGGGGGAGSIGSHVAGGGGGAGGMIVIVANEISGVGSLSAIGGDGGGAEGANAGSGGGGGGGVIFIAARQYDGNLTCDVSGGAGGVGGGVGSPGSNGVIEVHKIEDDGTLTFMGSSCTIPAF